MVKAKYGGVLEKGVQWYREDLKALTSQIKDHESLLRLKRRWLMDLPLSASEQKRLEEILVPSDKIIPESLLREDDVSYENIKTCIEMGIGAHKRGVERVCVCEDDQVFKSYDCKDILFLLDDMTNTGLCSLIEILAGGMFKFEKTNCRMKRTIKELLSKVITEKNDVSKAKLKQIFQLLEDPKTYCENLMVQSTASEAYRAEAVNILDGLEDFPSRTLSAMHRKLRRVRGYIPTMEPQKSGRGRGKLISIVRKMSMEMLSDLVDVDEPSEPLAGALGVAGLTLKLLLNRQDVRDFRKFPPEIEALQSDIAKAIHLLNDRKRVSLKALNKVQRLLDPYSDLSVRSLRMAVRNLLTDYLFECGDMDKVPDFLVETLNILNIRSQLPIRRKHSSSRTHSSPKELMKEVIQKEVECVLTVSAQAKEVVLALHSGHEFDEDFAHAYLDDFEESDILCACDDDGERVGNISEDHELHSDCSYWQAESVGETTQADLNSPVSSEQDGPSPFLIPERLNSTQESINTTQVGSGGTYGFDHSPFHKELKIVVGQCMDSKDYPSGCTRELGLANSGSFKVTTKQSSSLSHSRAKSPSCYALKSEETRSFFAATPKVEENNFVCQVGRCSNHYLEVQEACDATSIVAYHYVGQILDKLVRTEGLALHKGDRSYLESHLSVPDDSPGNWSSIWERF